MASPSPFIIPNCLTIAPSSSQPVSPLYLHYPNLSHHCTFIIQTCLNKYLHHPKLSHYAPSSSQTVSLCSFIIPNCLTMLLHHPKLSHYAPSSSQTVSLCSFIIPNCLTMLLHHPKLFHYAPSSSQTVSLCSSIIPNCLTMLLHHPKLFHYAPSSSQTVSLCSSIIPNCLTMLLHHPKLSYHCTFIIPCSQQVFFSKSFFFLLQTVPPCVRQISCTPFVLFVYQFTLAVIMTSSDPEKSQWLANLSAVYILTVLCWCYVYEAFFHFVLHMKLYEQRQAVLSWWSHQVPSSSQTVWPLYLLHPKLSHQVTS